MKPPRPVSVLLIREHAEQVTGSGCCGKLSGDDSLVGDTSRIFAEARSTQEHFGLLHRAIREFFPANSSGGELPPVRVVTVDPRNQLYLLPKLARDVWHYRPGWRDALRTLSLSFSLPAVIVNGRVLSRRGRTVDPDAICHAVAEALGRRIPADVSVPLAEP